MPASDMFWDSFEVKGGSIVVSCVCGRTHFVDSDTADFEEKELEEYRALVKENPEKVYPS